MLDQYLVSEKTAVTAKGNSSPVDISALANRVFLFHLNISGVVEQESLDVAIMNGSDPVDAKEPPKPLAAFPQLFYAGRHSLLLDLRRHPDVKSLRARWEVNRWGRGPETPWFEFSLKATEVAPELLPANRG